MLLLLLFLSFLLQSQLLTDGAGVIFADRCHAGSGGHDGVGAEVFFGGCDIQ